jgi:hypothetical protein
MKKKKQAKGRLIWLMYLKNAIGMFDLSESGSKAQSIVKSKKLGFAAFSTQIGRLRVTFFIRAVIWKYARKILSSEFKFFSSS